ncbi:MAG: hypothetical protein AAF488_08970 [Planctomycetota bacterium]
MRSSDVNSIRLSSSAGWSDSNLEFLRDLPFLHGLDVYCWSLQDVEAIESLQELRHLGLEVESKHPLRFDNFPRLQSLLVTWRPGFESSLSTKSLRYLNVERFPYRTLEEFQLPHLERLDLSSRDLGALTGLEACSQLKSLDLLGRPALTSIEALQNLPALEVISIDGSKELKDLTPLARCQKLRRLVLENCGSIESLSFLEPLEELTHLFFLGDTTIDDGDLSAATRLPQLKELRFRDRPSYSHSYEELERMLKNR